MSSCVTIDRSGFEDGGSYGLPPNRYIPPELPPRHHACPLRGSGLFGLVTILHSSFSIRYTKRSSKKVAKAPLKYSPPKRNNSLLLEGDPIRVADERGDGGSQGTSVTLTYCACYRVNWRSVRPWRLIYSITQTQSHEDADKKSFFFRRPPPQSNV